MCTELEVTLQGQLRTGAEREELLNKWDELSNYQIGMRESALENMHFFTSEYFYLIFRFIFKFDKLRFEQLSTSLCAKGLARGVAIT